MHSSAFSYTYHKFKFLSRFNNIPELESNQQFKSKHIQYYRISQLFVRMIKFVFWNVFKIWMSVWYMKRIGKYFYLFEFLEISTVVTKLKRNNLHLWNRNAAMKKTTIISLYIACHRSIFTKNGHQNHSLKSEKCFKTRHAPKVCIYFKTVKCSKIK